MKQKRTPNRLAELAKRKIAAISRTGDCYVQTGNISQAGVSHKTLTKVRLEPIKIGKPWEKQENHDTKRANRAEIAGMKRKVAQGTNSHSIGCQFPLAEKLADGRNRFFVKYGITVDRA